MFFRQNKQNVVGPKLSQKNNIFLKANKKKKNPLLLGNIC
jgi:hypothetical protein